MMTKLYLISAGESEGPLFRIAEGHLDSDLTPRGRRQVQALGERFSSLPVDAVYTSDLYRARATAEAICRSRGLPLHQTEKLRELFLGAWEGKSWGTLSYEKPHEVNCMHTTPGRWQIGGAETPAAGTERLLAVLEKIARQHEGQTVAVVSHTLVLHLALSVLEGIPLPDVRQTKHSAFTAVSLLEWDGAHLRLLSRSDTSHLSHDLSEPPASAASQPELNTDMYFQRLRWVEYGAFLTQAVECVWDESGEDRPFDPDRLLEDAAILPTTIGFVEYDPAGILQMSNLEPERITLLCTHPGCRRAGLGTQLVGQAVLSARASGEPLISVALPPSNPHRDFFLKLGFVPAGKTESGRELLEKDIRIDSNDES